MKRLIDIIDERIQSIDDLLSKLPALKYSNGYRIYRKQNKNSYYYYMRHTDDNKRNSDYIGVHYSDNAKELYRDVAFTEAVKVLKMNKQSLIDFKKTYIPISTSSIYRYLPECLATIPIDPFKDNLIVSTILSIEDDTYSSLMMTDKYKELCEWASEEYEVNSLKFGDAENIACDGKRVRSKGEALWYNALKKWGIPFRDNPVIYLEDKAGHSIVKTVDFLIKCMDGTYIIIEHLGLLNQPNYLNEFANKVKLFHENGYVLGVNFFVLSDDYYGGTNRYSIEELVKMIRKRVFR